MLYLLFVPFWDFLEIDPVEPSVEAEVAGLSGDFLQVAGEGVLGDLIQERGEGLAAIDVVGVVIGFEVVLAEG